MPGAKNQEIKENKILKENQRSKLLSIFSNIFKKLKEKLQTFGSLATARVFGGKDFSKEIVAQMFKNGEKEREMASENPFEVNKNIVYLENGQYISGTIMEIRSSVEGSVFALSLADGRTLDAVSSDKIWPMKYFEYKNEQLSENDKMVLVTEPEWEIAKNINEAEKGDHLLYKDRDGNYKECKIIEKNDNGPVVNIEGKKIIISPAAQKYYFTLDNIKKEMINSDNTSDKFRQKFDEATQNSDDSKKYATDKDNLEIGSWLIYKDKEVQYLKPAASGQHLIISEGKELTVDLGELAFKSEPAANIETSEITETSEAEIKDEENIFKDYDDHSETDEKVPDELINTKSEEELDNIEEQVKQVAKNLKSNERAEVFDKSFAQNRNTLNNGQFCFYKEMKKGNEEFIAAKVISCENEKIKIMPLNSQKTKTFGGADINNIYGYEEIKNNDRLFTKVQNMHKKDELREAWDAVNNEESLDDISISCDEPDSLDEILNDATDEINNDTYSLSNEITETEIGE